MTGADNTDYLDPDGWSSPLSIDHGTACTETHQPTPQHIINALTATRALIAQGWCKGKAQHGNQYCLVGALAESTMTDPDSTVPGYLIWRQALAAINSQIPAPFPNAVAYNDATNQHAVLQVIDNAITYVQQVGNHD